LNPERGIFDLDQVRGRFASDRPLTRGRGARYPEPMNKTARTFGILMSLEPAVAALAGWVFLHEVLSPRQWLAVALVIAASAGSTLTSRRAKQVAEGESGEGWQGG
jgi:hypothetical protein